VSNGFLAGDSKLASERHPKRPSCFDAGRPAVFLAMTQIMSLGVRFAVCGMLAVVGTGAAPAQDNTSASGLIRYLTYQTNRPGKEDLLFGPFTCGTGFAEAEQDREIATELAALGESAVPAIEGALDSIVARGFGSEFIINSEWLMYAYAKIKGPDAFERLQRLKARPELGSREYSLDGAISLSLGLTSYADSRRGPPMVVCREQEPRDALDSVILAWERNSRPSLESAIGPNGKAALQAAVSQHGWDSLRKDLPPKTAAISVAVGYRFDIPGSWSAPVETLDPETNHPPHPAPNVVAIRTHFKNRSGGACITFPVKFVRLQDRQSSSFEYFVDNADLEDLLGVISRCASEK
jgi:hypothetical protein